MRVRRAVVLAAGFGSRLWPLTRETPKALLPFEGEPLLLRNLRMLRDWGVREVLVNAHHLGEQVISFAASNPVPGLRLQVSHEPEILGTGGALTKAEWFLDDRPLWVLNADVVAEVDPAPLLRHHGRTRPLATLWMHAGAGPRTVRVRDEHVVDFADPQPGSEGTATFSGLQILDRRVLDFLPVGFASVIDAYRAGMAAGHRVSGVEVPGARWADLGTPEQTVAAHGGRFVHPRARVHPRAVVESGVVQAEAELGPRARVRGAVVAGGTRVHGPVNRLAVPARLALEPELHAVLPAWCDGASADVLAPRGSDREFWRLQRGQQRALLMVAGSARPENARFAGHARFLASRGVDVPEILLARPDLGVVLAEDLGDDELLHAPTPARYRQCVNLMKRLHAVRVPKSLALEPPFTRGYLRWEHDLFIQHFLRREPSPALRNELERLATQLARAPRVLLHRDLQSTNILFHRGRPHLIDFQGMRMGPAMYDLASLLADPYVDLDEETQRALLEQYTDDSTLRRQYAAACAQRLLQALGAFGRLGARPATRRFLDHVPAALRQLRRATRSLAGFPELSAMPERLEG